MSRKVIAITAEDEVFLARLGLGNVSGGARAALRYLRSLPVEELARIKVDAPRGFMPGVPNGFDPFWAKAMAPVAAPKRGLASLVPHPGPYPEEDRVYPPVMGNGPDR